MMTPGLNRCQPQPASSPFDPLSNESARGPKPDYLPYWPAIASKDKIPEWLQDNDYILGSHPMPTYSYERSLRLWRCFHMETMNIWTHLLSSLAFITVVAFGSFLASVAICFGLSAGFHTLRSHSYSIHYLWGKMDILGICPMYWGLNLFSAIGAAITLFDTGGGGSKMRTLRGRVFSLLAVSAMLPVIQTVIERGWTSARNEIGAGWYLAEAFSLLTGVTLFVCRFPERLSPGTFDIWGHSHQLWHAFAVLGCVFHFFGLVTAYNHHWLHKVC
ncbi:unnamed protein product [Penicillium salamii]|uniref:Uncharacterized protein n=1 Tax=Penicillium salamii TaxID=1612424 RepID=A0A9W4JAA1_9EURO|nr:unnamed protein product [Penicillium salamii]